MIPNMTQLNFPMILEHARRLPLKGMTKITDNQLVYLDIDDDYIHQLFPLFKNEKIKKPDYFREKSAGAHVTLFYPEEGKKIDKNDLDKEHHFIIKDLVAAEIGNKTYCVLLVDSPSLVALRKKCGLGELLSFKGYFIGLHITIGVATDSDWVK